VIWFHESGGHWFGSGLGIPELLLMALFGVLQIAFWIAVVVIVVRLLRRDGRGPRSAPALQVLEERYARGEITRDEFVERQAVLLGREPPATR
jgi:putative membrane protein